MSDSAVRTGSDEEWHELTRPLRRQAQAQPQPFFYARVHARLLASTRPAYLVLPSWLRRPVYVAAVGALVLAVSGDGAATARSNHHHAYPVQQASR